MLRIPKELNISDDGMNNIKLKKRNSEEDTKIQYALLNTI